MTLRTELGHTIIVARSDQHRHDSSGSFKAGESVVARFAIPNWLTPARYMLTPSLAREGTGEDALALRRGHGLDRGPRHRSGGILELPHRVRGSSAYEHERGHGPARSHGRPRPRVTACTAPPRSAAACTASGR